MKYIYLLVLSILFTACNPKLPELDVSNNIEYKKISIKYLD